MVEVKCFKTDCGKVYQSKQAAKSHEKICHCWKNPKFKTCLTCKFHVKTYDAIGCGNVNMDPDLHFKPAHPKAPNLNINCPFWEINL